MYFHIKVIKLDRLWKGSPNNVKVCSVNIEGGGEQGLIAKNIFSYKINFVFSNITNSYSNY